MHRAGVDPRAGRDAGLDELLEPLETALARAHPIDEHALPVADLHDRFDREERADGRLRA
jgi:hypothetical protein